MNNLLILAASTWAMTGLIWFVQIVHYPLLLNVGLENFTNYEKAHCQLTSYVVVIPMITQLIFSFLTAFQTGNNWLWINFALVIVIWLITAFWSVPLHNSLCIDFSADVHKKLIVMNWIRTVAWSCTAIIVTYVLWSKE